jgi:hypothetical protein
MTGPRATRRPRHRIPNRPAQAGWGSVRVVRTNGGVRMVGAVEARDDGDGGGDGRPGEEDTDHQQNDAEVLHALRFDAGTGGPRVTTESPHYPDAGSGFGATRSPGCSIRRADRRRMRRPAWRGPRKPRRAEECHHAVTRELVDTAIEAVDALAEDGEEAFHQPAPLLRIHLGGKVHRTGDIGEEHRDLLPLRRRRLCSRSAGVGKTGLQAGSACHSGHSPPTPRSPSRTSRRSVPKGGFAPPMTGTSRPDRKPGARLTSTAATDHGTETGRERLRTEG